MKLLMGFMSCFWVVLLSQVKAEATSRCNMRAMELRTVVVSMALCAGDQAEIRDVTKGLSWAWRYWKSLGPAVIAKGTKCELTRAP